MVSRERDSLCQLNGGGGSEWSAPRGALSAASPATRHSPEVTLPLSFHQLPSPPPAAGAPVKPQTRCQRATLPLLPTPSPLSPRGRGEVSGTRAGFTLSRGERRQINPEVTSSPRRVFLGEPGWGREAAFGSAGRAGGAGRGGPRPQQAGAGGGRRRSGGVGRGGWGRGPGTHVLLKTPPRALPSRRQSCCEKKTQEIWGSELCVWQRRSSSVGPRKAMHRPKLKKTLQ